MKHVILICLLFCTIKANGQNHLLGVKVGVSSSNVNGTIFSTDRNSRTGVAAGITYDYRLNKHFFIGTELNYIQRGFTIDMIFYDEFGHPVDRYRILPLQLRLCFSTNQGWVYEGRKVLRFC